MFNIPRLILWLESTDSDVIWKHVVTGIKVHLRRLQAALLKRLASGYTIQAGGPVAERFRQRTHNPWGNPKQVRLLPGPPSPLRDATDGTNHRVPPQSVPSGGEVGSRKIFRIPSGAYSETRPFDAHWSAGIGIFEQLVICPRAPRGLTGLADGVGAR